MTKQLQKKLIVNYLVIVGIYTAVTLLYKNGWKMYLVGMVAITAGSGAGILLRLYRNKKADEKASDKKGATVVIDNKNNK